MTSRLSVSGLSKSFGGFAAVVDVSLTLPDGARTALIGPNGAGKTTVVNLITGVLSPNAGRVELQGIDVTTASAAVRVKAGMARTFQISKLFKDLTVEENVRVAVQLRRGMGMSVWSPTTALEEALAEIKAVLTDLQLTKLASRKVGAMSLGQQRLVELALALALKPGVLLLDEPAAGVPKGESGIILDAVERLPGDLAVLLIEHEMDLVFRFARRIIVLANGRPLAEGSPQEIAADDRVRQVYFGKGAIHGH
jgi:branched-chain amino acid transport system ATP-binding protein